MISVPEFEAMRDVLDDTIGEVERMTVDELVDVRIAIEAVVADARKAIAAIDMTLKDRMEVPVVRHGYQYTVVPDTTYVYDHDLIAREVARRCSYDPETGERLAPDRAVAEVARAMKLLYTSGSTKAKVGMLEELDIDPRDVRERKGDMGTKRLDIRPSTTPETPRAT